MYFVDKKKHSQAKTSWPMATSLFSQQSHFEQNNGKHRENWKKVSLLKKKKNKKSPRYAATYLAQKQTGKEQTNKQTNKKPKQTTQKGWGDIKLDGYFTWLDFQIYHCKRFTTRKRA